MNERYKAYLKSAGGPTEGRRALVAYALAHGNKAAARMSGAETYTIRYLLRRAKKGGMAAIAGPGHPPLSSETRARIMAAKRASPKSSAAELKKLYNLSPCPCMIMRVIREHGLTTSRWKRPKYRPAFRVEVWERRIEFTRIEVAIELYAMAHALKMLAKGIRSHVKPRLSRAYQRLEEAKRKTAFWRGRLRLEPQMNADGR